MDICIGCEEGCHCDPAYDAAVRSGVARCACACHGIMQVVSPTVERRGAAVARKPHKLQVAGSIPAAATNPVY